MQKTAKAVAQHSAQPATGSTLAKRKAIEVAHGMASSLRFYVAAAFGALTKSPLRHPFQQAGLRNQALAVAEHEAWEGAVKHFDPVDQAASMKGDLSFTRRQLPPDAEKRHASSELLALVRRQ